MLFRSADAASLWFTGKPLAEGKGLKDQLGTSGAGYVDQYLGHLGVAPAQTGPGLDELNRQFQVEFLDKTYPKEQPQVAPTQAAPQSTVPSWGALQNLGSEALLKGGPLISAGAQAGREMLRDIGAGTSPLAAFDLARNIYYPQAKSQYETAQGAWAKENPGAALTTEIAGQAAPIFAGIGAMNVGLRGAAALAPRIAPATNFLTGAGATAVPGVGGMALRGAGDLATGALQGGVGNAIVGQDPLQGALWGGALGVPLGAAGRAFLAPERATARPEVAQAAERYLGLGGELPASAIVESPKIAKTLEAVAGKGGASSVENFNALLADLIGGREIGRASCRERV